MKYIRSKLIAEQKFLRIANSTQLDLALTLIKTLGGWYGLFIRNPVRSRRSALTGFIHTRTNVGQDVQRLIHEPMSVKTLSGWYTNQCLSRRSTVNTRASVGRNVQHVWGLCALSYIAQDIWRRRSLSAPSCSGLVSLSGCKSSW